ncbi:hypothetical protein [Gordonia neofelifaecis]|uniref:NADH-ubiquinone/plastoquinone n=1 Tax=Gordonia neofelifaecis NRRL B-59395 TaxID=644548 RepID=F1YJU3_9ACTN|nr:hypothetical protein [Gordonia neofelifaecis]EGD55025.1 hypothetical protein SCNU_10866 [Gordonia neofelifaecis NRRL B-59395]
MTNANVGASTSRVLVPSVVKQCVGFMIGSALFALGSAPGFGSWAGATTANVCYFAGSWFFTAAGLIQLVLSGARTVPVSYAPGQMFRAEWLAASTQFFGTLLFNVSTGAALMAHTPAGEDHLVWTPDAAGSVAFLISGVFVLVAFTRATGKLWDVRSRDWWAGQINFIGCVAFGVSAVASYISPDGVTVDAVLANAGTFIGAICFFVASGIILPRALAER